jgi:uncharacterized protein (UPF0332 family)
VRFSECLKKRLIWPTDEARDWIEKEMAIARRHLDNAKTCLNTGMIDLSIVASYTSMFHCARTLLFLNGYRERSHVCIIAFIKERYPDLITYADVMDIYREARHTMLYGMDPEVFKDDAEEGINYASEFIEEVGILIQDDPEDT